MDVARRTNTTKDVLLESRIDDCWNVDGGKELQGPWTGCTQFTILNGKPPNGHTWSQGGDSQMFMQHSGLIICGRKCGQACWKQLNKKEEQNWAAEQTETRQCSEVDRQAHRSARHGVQGHHEKRAQRIGGACLVRLRTLGTERPSAQRLPTLKDQKYACIVEAHESTRTRSAKSRREITKVSSQKKGLNSLTRYSVCQLNRYRYCAPWKFRPDAKAAVDK